MSLRESKAPLEGVQDFMIAQQIGEDLERRRAGPHSGQRHTAKDSRIRRGTQLGSITAMTANSAPEHIHKPTGDPTPALYRDEN